MKPATAQPQTPAAAFLPDAAECKCRPGPPEAPRADVSCGQLCSQALTCPQGPGSLLGSCTLHRRLEGERREQSEQLLPDKPQMGWAGSSPPGQQLWLGSLLQLQALSLLSPPTRVVGALLPATVLMSGSTPGGFLLSPPPCMNSPRVPYLMSPLFPAGPK